MCPVTCRSWSLEHHCHNLTFSFPSLLVELVAARPAFFLANVDIHLIGCYLMTKQLHCPALSPTGEGAAVSSVSFNSSSIFKSHLNGSSKLPRLSARDT